MMRIKKKNQNQKLLWLVMCLCSACSSFREKRQRERETDRQKDDDVKRPNGWACWVISSSINEVTPLTAAPPHIPSYSLASPEHS
jgi:hypothetical protein